MKIPIFLATMVAFLCTTLSGYADRKPTKREREAAAKKAEDDAIKARMAEERERRNPSDQTLIEILRTTDVDIQSKAKAVLENPANKDVHSISVGTQLQEALQGTYEHDYFIMSFQAGDRMGLPVSDVHEKYPQKPEEGKPALLKVLMRSRTGENGGDIRYFVAYLPHTFPFSSVKFFHVYVQSKIGMFVIPVNKTGFDMTEFAYRHVPSPVGKDTCAGGIWLPTVERLQELHSKVVKVPVISSSPTSNNAITSTLPVAPTSPSPFLKSQTP